MWRSVCVVAIAYGCGHPRLDGYRPAALDAPLQAFYQQVNKAAGEAVKVLTSLNASRAAYFKAYMGQVERQLPAAK